MIYRTSDEARTRTGLDPARVTRTAFLRADLMRAAFLRSAVVAVLACTLMAGKCEPVDTRAALERVPQAYRACFDTIVRIEDYETNGKISWRDAKRLIVDLRASELRLQRCGKGAIAWVDAQHAALNAFYRSY